MTTNNNPTSPREELAMKVEPNGANPYYTPTIMAAFRAYKEAQYGGKMADDAFRLGNGKYEDEPYYTQMAIEFRLFKAGAEWVEAFRAADPDFSRPPVKAASPEGADALLAEAAALFRRYEREHYRKAEDAIEKGDVANAESSAGKATTNGVMAGRIELFRAAALRDSQGED